MNDLTKGLIELRITSLKSSIELGNTIIADMQGRVDAHKKSNEENEEEIKQLTESLNG